MAEKSSKHGAWADQQLAAEAEGLVRGTGPTRAEEGAETEPVETDDDRDPTAAGASQPIGAPPGMTPEDVEARSAVARVLAGVDYPATPGTLAAHAADQGAPEGVVSRLGDLPDRPYDGFPEIVDELGYGHENRRF